MWKSLLDYFARLFKLADATEQNKTEIKEIQRELRDLTATVQYLFHEVRSVRQDQRHDMEKLVLRLENELLKFERKLSPSRHGKAGK